MKFLLALLIVLSAAPAHAAGRSITYYLDGARFEEESAATRGYLEIALPAAVVPDSLRIRPLAGSSIARVEIQKARPTPKREKELDALLERKRRLEDRLRALEVREDIFKAAAKSQSSKAPRKTKTNPEPMETIRKGTEFAVAQLEVVYRARRSAEDGIKAVEARLSALRKEGGVGGSVARVWVGGKGRITASYLVAGSGWTPVYDFRLDGSGAMDVTLHALFPRPDKGTTAAVVAAPLAATDKEASRRAIAAPFGEVLKFHVPAVREIGGQSGPEGMAVSFVNGAGAPLPPGEATIFRSGEYLGKAAFKGVQPGATGEVVLCKGFTAALD
ncbi:DUF4140 domain-containing protein [Geobacter pickeringii]|uniref:DUF4140 domain-containing protein n=1 Tax=Geobacter pickeringii TaxID=345632 RepID=A0A0B5BAH3_9BACT|nr:DUF4140 domain-containing protein [Geobacter pickeringii]AJE03728.1 hypothetical protein GPICK_10530 [Geobacter pickeringii]